jgi:ABC-type transport system involved in multi-copper enzyme maturation permease subunit
MHSTHTIATITWLTFHEARQRKMVLLALILGLLFLGLFSLGFWFIQREIQLSNDVPAMMRDSIYNFFLMAGLYVVHFLTVMIAIFSSVDTVSGEITTHTIQAIATKPVRRWHIIMGKWLGFAAMVSLYLLLLTGGIMLSVYLMVGYIPPNPVQGILLLMLEALVLISLSLLGGTFFSTMSNGVALFMLYGLAFIGAWVEQIGSLLQSGNAVRIGIISSLLMPVEALWRRAAYLMQPSISRELGVTPFSTSSVPAPAMVVYAGVYAVAALVLAMYAFSRRDL